MTHQHLQMATHVDNYPGEVVVLRECLVRICGGNHCAAMMLDYFYERTLILMDVKAHEQRYRREEMSTSITSSSSDLEKMMCGLFTEEEIDNALTLLLEKDYLHDFETWGESIIFDVDIKMIDCAVVALREQQRQQMTSTPQAQESVQAAVDPVADEHAIYALIDPKDNSIHYIGMSRNATKRYRQHVACSGTNLLKNMWVTDLLREGMRPVLTIIETVDGIQTARNRETFWINHYLAQGAPLTNWNQNEALRNSDGGSSSEEPPFIPDEFLNRGE